ncbi:DUF262 domain-containing protein [uncultured Sutterella sp.]|uniref:DUF262 domain-containing protein n=1 Tax=uncultured Sutterella sp. TaxID=286133 RepID=UPI00280A70BD|nr:DUF262 domain-containing protein [uncultured Sutterella sp.]
MNTDEARVENDAKAQAGQSFEASLESIGSLREQIEEKKLSLVIPAFQRGYSWREEQVAQLMEDLIDAWRSSHSEPYSLGTIVCTRSTGKNSNELQVLDGQQRLTTIDILLNELSPKEKKDKNRCGELIAAYRYLTAKENADKTRLPRHDLQMKAIRDRLEDVDRARFLEWLKENILVMLVVLPLKAGAQNEASKMFEIINVRGQQLSLLDQLKSRFLQIFGDAHPLDRSFFNQIWNDCERRLSSYEECVKGHSFDEMKAAMKAAEGSVEAQRKEFAAQGGCAQHEYSGGTNGSAGCARIASAFADRHAQPPRNGKRDSEAADGKRRSVRIVADGGGGCGEGHTLTLRLAV